MTAKGGRFKILSHSGNRDYYLYAALILYAVIAVLTITRSSATGGSGDSILHYLFAKYAPQHPENFFKHWAKPVYVLLATPFAQFGFTGIKIFNALCTFFTIIFTFRIAEKAKLKNYVLIPVFLIFAPLYYRLTFSGLTEPLFALALSVIFYLHQRNKFIFAAILLSFLPFVRSEGLLFIGLFGLFYIIKRQYKTIIFLLTGHVIYAFAGLFIYDSIFWVFTHIPYNTLDSVYGNGNIFHFVNHFHSVVGIPVFVLLIAGLIDVFRRLFLKTKTAEPLILSFVGFLIYLFAHSAFWALGIFNSMGLLRVMIAIMPLIAIISLEGFNLLSERVFDNSLYKKISKLILAGAVLIFPFVPNPASIEWEKDMKPTKEQILTEQAVCYIKSNDLDSSRLFYNNPYLSLLLEKDHFDPKTHLNLNKNNLRKIKRGDVVIWDTWFSGYEHNVTQKYIESNFSLRKINEFVVEDGKRKIRFIIYQKQK